MPEELPPIIGRPVTQYAVEEAFAACSSTFAFVSVRTECALEDRIDSPPERERALEASRKFDLAASVREAKERDVHLCAVPATAARQAELGGEPHTLMVAELAEAGRVRAGSATAWHGRPST